MEGIFCDILGVKLHVFFDIKGNRRHQHRLMGTINSEYWILVGVLLANGQRITLSEIYQAGKTLSLRSDADLFTRNTHC